MGGMTWREIYSDKRPIYNTRKYVLIGLYYFFTQIGRTLQDCLGAFIKRVFVFDSKIIYIIASRNLSDNGMTTIKQEGIGRNLLHEI